jgi:formate/nitrite transporter FocA (FNT family)
MHYGQLFLGSLAGTFVFFLYGFLINGMLIGKHYQPYGTVYRPAPEVMKHFPLGIAGTFIAIVALSVVLAKAFPAGADFVDAIHFGVLVGVIMTCTHVVDNYVTLNIGRKLAGEMALASFFQWVLVAVVIGHFHPPGITAAP